MHAHPPTFSERDLDPRLRGRADALGLGAADGRETEQKTAAVADVRRACPDDALAGDRFRMDCGVQLRDLVRTLGPWWFLQAAPHVPPGADEVDLTFDGDVSLFASTTIDCIAFTVPNGHVGVLHRWGRDYRFVNPQPDPNPPTWHLRKNGGIERAHTTIYRNSWADGAECIPYTDLEPLSLWVEGGDVVLVQATGAVGEPGGRSVNARLYGWTAPMAYFARVCAEDLDVSKLRLLDGGR